MSEGKVVADLRLVAPSKGCVLWRNNVGASIDHNGRHIRFGLGNDSQKLNRVFKSSDLIGVRSVVVTQEMVGSVIGQFVAIECKRPGWNYPNPTNIAEYQRASAQKAFIDKVNEMGGYAKFATKAGDLFDEQN